MKISNETFADLSREVAAIEGRFPNLRNRYREHGLSATRYRWDILSGIPGEMLARLYREGLEDSHIDTALRRIIKD